MRPTLRAFLAVEISGEVIAQASKLVRRLSATEARVRWVEPSQLHFTVKFLGDVPTVDVHRLCEVAGRAIAEVAPFDLSVEGVGAFPTAARARTIWLGTGEGSEQLVALQQRLEEVLVPLGFRPEPRRYRPHLTIGRVRGSEGLDQLGQLIEQHAGQVAAVTTVEEVTFFSSQLTPAGPVYDALAHLPLG